MPLRNTLNRALSARRNSSSAPPLASSPNASTSTGAAQSASDEPMRKPHPSADRVPEINAVLEQISSREYVEPIRRQLAEEWNKVSSTLQTPTTPGSITTPAVTLNIPTVLNSLEHGKLTVRLFLVPGAVKLGALRQTVKPNTYFDISVEVHKGIVQPESTQLFVCRKGDGSDGCLPRQKPNPRRSKLSGPVPLPLMRRLFGLKAITFDDHKLNAILTGGISHNLNKELGLPASPELKVGDFIARLLDLGGFESDLVISEAQTYAISETAGVRQDAVTDHPPVVSAQDDNQVANETEGLDWLDLEKIRFQFKGDFMAGDLPLGEGSSLKLRRGSSVEITDAGPKKLTIKFDAALEGMQLEAQGSRWSCGEGRAKFDLALESPEPLGAPDHVSLMFSEINLNKLSLSVPANVTDDLGQPLMHQLHLSTLALKAQDGADSQDEKQSPKIIYDNLITRNEAPTFANAEGGAAVSASLNISLPELSLERASAVLHTLGAGHGSGRLQMGMGDGHWAKAPMTIVTGLSVKSTPQEQRFKIDGKVASGRLDLVANGEGQQARIGLVSAQHFALAARAVRLEGTGHFGFEQEGQKPPHLYLMSDAQEQPWCVVIEDYDASLSAPAQGLKVNFYDQGLDHSATDHIADDTADEGQFGALSPMPDRRRLSGLAQRAMPWRRLRSQLALRSLAFGGPLDNVPSFDALGTMAVTLGRLQYRGADQERNLGVQGGSHGELVIRKALWAAEAPVPEIDVTLLLNAGGDVQFAVSEIKTLEGADINVRVGDRGANLALDFKTDIAGTVRCDTDFSLIEGQVRTRVLQMPMDDFTDLQQALREDAHHPVMLGPPQQPFSEPLPDRAGFQLLAPTPLEPVPLAQVAPSLRLERMDDLMLSLVPRVKLNVEFLPILTAVQSAEVAADLPLSPFKHNRPVTTYLNLPVKVSFANEAGAKLRFSVENGKVNEGKIVFSPSLDINWGVVTCKVTEINLVAKGETGVLAVHPAAGFRLVGLPIFVPESVENRLVVMGLQYMFGRPDLPGELAPLVSVLSGASGQLRSQTSAHVVITPKTDEQQKASVAIQARLGPYVERGALRLAASPEESLSVEGAAVRIKAKKLLPFELDLGDNQKLACGDSSNVSLTLQDEMLQISGRLDLSGEQGATSIETADGYAFSFAEGAVDIDAAFSLGRTQSSHCELKNAHLKDLRFSARPMGLSQTFTVPEIQQGSVVLSYDSGKPRVTCITDSTTGGAPFTLTWNGMSAVGDQQFGANDLVFDGKLSQITFDNQGVNIAAPRVNLEAKQLMLPLAEGQHVMASLSTISAKVHININVKGGMQCDLTDCVSSANTENNTVVTLYEHDMPRDTFRFGPWLAEKISLAVGSLVAEPGLSARGFKCDALALEKRLDLYQDDAEEGSGASFK